MGRQATPRSDIYSVGILLYHCLTGEPPFSGDTKSVARQQLHRDPLPPRRLNRRISPGLEDVILKAISKDPSERYESAEEMKAALRRERPASIFAPAALGRLLEGRKRSLTTAALALVLLSGLAAAGVSGYVGGTGDLASSRSSEEGPAMPGKTEESGDSGGAGVTRGLSVFSGFGGSGETTGSEEKATVQEAEDSNEETTSSADYVTVPDVNAYYDYYAAEVLASQGLETKVVYDYHEGYSNRGVTWGTDPLPGEQVPEGSTVTIYATPKDQPQPQF